MSNAKIEIESAHLEGHIKLHKQDTAPTEESEHALVYATEDDTTFTHVFVKDSAGNETKISPHNANGEWEYFCRNTKTGKCIRINMERMIRKLEELTGESFIEEL